MAPEVELNPSPATSTNSADDRPSEEHAASNSIELPEFTIHHLESDQELLDRAGDTTPIASHPLAGVWLQSHGSTDADFGPGGYDESILMLNPATKIAALYRTFRGSFSIVMGAEFAIEIPAAVGAGYGSTFELKLDPSLSSKFPTSPVPLGGNPAQFAQPPQIGNPWSLEWKREGSRLTIDKKHYIQTSIDAFEALRRGNSSDATSERPKAADRTPTPATASAMKPRQAAFFGVSGGGKRFVFIVDVSGSMQGAKLDRLKAELTKSIQDLDADAEFSIVFFASGAEVIDQDWMHASADRNRVVQVIAQQGCMGGTDPTEAFEFAFKSLSPIPDCIFFMTDGQIPPWIPDHVRALNNAKIGTVINSIVVGTAAEEPAFRPLMEQISLENHGSYTFIPN